MRAVAFRKRLKNNIKERISMKRKEFKENLFATLNNPVDGMSYDEKMILVHSLLVDYEKDNEEKRDTSNKGGKWTDEELKIILSDAPTKENCVKYARLFKRGCNGVQREHNKKLNNGLPILHKVPPK